jgi:tetratricopeptide (TPR) repeat protein
MQKQIESLREYLILAIIFLFPITFASTFIDQIQTPKLIILGFLICLTIIVTAIQLYISGQIYYAKGKFDLPIFIIVLAYLLSAIFITPNKVEAFFIPGTASLVIGLGILYFLINTIADKNKVKTTLVASSVTLSLILLASFIGVFSKIPQLPAFVTSASFNPTGDFLTSTIYLAASLPFALYFLVKEKELLKKLTFAFCLVFILIAFGISLFTLLSFDKKSLPVLPPYQTSWAVAIDTIRENPLLGIGPGNYLSSFGRFRPVSYNLTNLWQLRFGVGRDWYLTIITETGIVGAIGTLFLIFSVFKLIDKNVSIYKESRSLMIDGVSLVLLVLLLIALAIFPPTATAMLLIFVFIALNSQAKVLTLTFSGNNLATQRVILCIILIGIVIFLGVQARPLILAEAKFKEANDTLIANNGKKTYDNLQQAINLNPYVDRYHASYAQVNLAIARSVITSVKDTKDLTDTQKSTVTQLIQQAIREGQNTVALNPVRAANWQVLANIYQVIIPFASQADQYAIQSYNQTIALDPIDPNVRISLGGLYYSLGQYDNAINSFQFAALAKSDLANAYYNLAAAYAAKNDFNNAIAAMNKVLSLVPKDSSDYKVASGDLDTLQKKQKTLQDTSSSTNLTTPQKAQVPAISPQLNLPQEASPPAGPKLPIVSPSPVVTATPPIK